MLASAQGELQPSNGRLGGMRERVCVCGGGAGSPTLAHACMPLRPAGANSLCMMTAKQARGDAGTVALPAAAH